MEFCHSYLFVTFVVMTLDQIVGRDDGPPFTVAFRLQFRIVFILTLI